MTKQELIDLLKDYPDNACIEVVNGDSVHFDVQSVVQYDDNGVQVAELVTSGVKNIPESIKRQTCSHDWMVTYLTHFQRRGVLKTQVHRTCRNCLLQDAPEMSGWPNKIAAEDLYNTKKGKE